MKSAPARIAAAALGLVLVALGLRAVAADLPEIRARGVLRHLGMPYANFVKADGQGFDVELVRGFAAHLGVRHELVRTDFYNVIPDLLGAEVVRKGDEITLEGSRPAKGDMIAAGFTVLPWRQKLVLYSAPTFPSQVLLVTRAESPHAPIAAQATLKADMAETRKVLARHSLLVMERTCLDPANYGLTGRGIDLRSYKGSTNLDDMVPALLRGEAEFTLLDVPDAVIDLQRWAGRIKVIGPISEHQELAAAFPRSAPALREAFDAYLRQIRADGRYDQLVNRYYPGIRSYFPEFFARRD
ncbi:Amino acid ABC transporter substrate-binding protein (PAAT family) [Rubrivivax sp. A210]|uniref:transporter substrate-binding domain-containing protein n=1 Tax=Rubrivivax sp. A210 TaxID=2772301 RepID=UPI00191AA4A0|nr:transporter substrate-binding domain-containing protein [Rubrivivax sp. A210]CAD5373359.1 Amino acid ABC transporter substrate-binding protein (PAAT family) [Rubrivivax sp. A210]